MKMELKPVKPDSDYNPEQLKRGIEVEQEHTNDVDLAKTIAKHHLNEFPTYYTALDEMETKLRKGESMITKEYITHSGSSWTVHAEDGKVLGTHGSEGEAKKQLQAIEINKHKQGLKYGGYESPEPGELGKKGKDILKKTYAGVRSGQDSSSPEDKEKAAKIAWSQVKKSGAKEMVIFTSAFGQHPLVFEEGRQYITNPSQAPKGVAVKRGKYGGLYYEDKPVRGAGQVPQPVVAKGPMAGKVLPPMSKTAVDNLIKRIGRPIGNKEPSKEQPQQPQTKKPTNQQEYIDAYGNKRTGIKIGEENNYDVMEREENGVKVRDYVKKSTPATPRGEPTQPQQPAQQPEGNLDQELNDLKSAQNDMTTSDLQGAVQVLAKKYNKDANELLNQIYEQPEGKGEEPKDYPTEGEETKKVLDYIQSVKDKGLIPTPEMTGPSVSKMFNLTPLGARNIVKNFLENPTFRKHYGFE